MPKKYFHIHGGVKKKNASKKGFVPLLHMLNSSSCRIKLLSSDSAYGYVFTIKVNPSDSEYLDLGTSNRFTVPVENYVLKVVMVHSNEDLSTITQLASEPTDENEDVLDFLLKLSPKRLMSEKDFLNESILQQLSWKESIKDGKKAICPSVADVAIIKDSGRGKVLDLIESKLDIETSHINDIRNAIKPPENCNLGLCLMPMVSDATSFRTYLYSNSSSPSINLYAELIAQIIRLYLEFGIFHLDLHEDNILISNNTTPVIIDFGLACDLLYNFTELCNVVGGKDTLIAKRNELLGRHLVDNSSNVSDADKIKFITDSMQVYLDSYEQNPPRFLWYSIFLKTRTIESKVLRVKAFDILAELMTPSTTSIPDTEVSEQALAQSCGEGCIFSPNNSSKPSDYYVDSSVFNTPLPSSPPSPPPPPALAPMQPAMAPPPIPQIEPPPTLTTSPTSGFDAEFGQEPPVKQGCSGLGCTVSGGRKRNISKSSRKRVSKYIKSKKYKKKSRRKTKKRRSIF